MQEGVGYASSIVEMPNVTGERLEWWFCWHPLESMRYKIWNPKVHYGNELSSESRRKLLDQNIPVRERTWDTPQIVVKDSDFGATKLELIFKSPKDFGFDMKRFSSGAETAIAGGSDNMIAVHVARNKGTGIELKSGFWFPEGTPLSVMKDLSFHGLEEYTHLAHILPGLFKEFTPKVK